MSELHLGIVMDPISRITPAKDSSLTMLLVAKRGVKHDQSRLKMIIISGLSLASKLICR
jgi:hypothetical protein